MGEKDKISSSTDEEFTEDQLSNAALVRNFERGPNAASSVSSSLDTFLLLVTAKSSRMSESESD